MLDFRLKTTGGKLTISHPLFARAWSFRTGAVRESARPERLSAPLSVAAQYGGDTAFWAFIWLIVT